MGMREFFGGWQLPWQKEPRVLGVDIGTSSIKVVQLRKEKERAILETYGELSIGPYAELKIGQAVKLPEDKIIEALKDLLREANVKAKTATVAIPLASSFITLISLPFSSDDEFSEIIKMEARRYIPIPLSEVVLDWWVIPEISNKQSSDRKKFTSVLLAAIHKDTVNAYRNIVSGARLEAKFYEIECFSTIRSCLSKGNSPVAIIDFGASTTKLTVVDYGIMKEAHSISHGSQELTLALSRSLNIDFSRAEEMKREIGLSDLPENQQVVSIFEPILSYIFLEVNRFIKDFQKKSNRSVGKVVLSGGGSLLKGLVDFSVKKFTIEVELADPFSRVEYPILLSSVIKEVGVNFSTATGLALRDL